MYINFTTHHEWRVMLDGVDISDECFAADDVKGEAHCYEMDALGNFVWDFNGLGDRVLRTCVKRGKVELIPPAPGPDIFAPQASKAV